MIAFIFVTFCTIGHLEGLALSGLTSSGANTNITLIPDALITSRIQLVGNLVFDDTVVSTASIHRKIACFFVFDKEASDDLNGNINYARSYATQLAALASKYTAHANIVIVNAGTEIWSNGDQISFAVGNNSYSGMPDILTQFQAYLANTQKLLFGTIYAIGVLLSNKNSLVAGGYSQGPACTTEGASLINYRSYPWSIAGLLAHELAHTLSVVHPFELSYICDYYKTQLKFCSAIPAECLCSSNNYPPQQCLMTFQFGQANLNAPRYTSCDIEMMNYFSPNVSCLA
ncbi:unnamed protein product [Rotaria socialis]|uniref:Peptidase M12B domain-containing protein n=1 Tax=Rotaria socialis TaxID=392032 RepID=A0A820KHF7_9BILA|nr:unnamed protein product [Rotaria socialis]CAF3390214.1 unnamed protein product [Rotaria socialis]CAF4344349.1 unnamed protein product [Rotaria socialis]CAF4474172.1 unnamed protein product [Rotaria socialis]